MGGDGSDRGLGVGGQGRSLGGFKAMVKIKLVASFVEGWNG